MFLEVVVALYTLYYIVTLYFNHTKYPKGPLPLPIVGNFPHVIYTAWKEKGIVNALRAYKRIYGNVFTLWFGPLPTVHITDYETAKDQMVKHGSDYSLRYLPKIQQHNREGLGIVFNDGPLWQEHRRFALQTLRNFGLGRNIMEAKIMKEFNHKLDVLKKTMINGEVVINPMTFFDILIGNIINKLLFSERFSEDSKDFWFIKKLLDELMEKVTFIDMLTPYWLMESPLLKWRLNEIQHPLLELQNFIRSRVHRRMNEVENGSRSLSEDAEDFTDAYLYKKQQDEKNGLETTFDTEALVIDLVDLWGAGQETTAATLTWATVLLLNKPEYIKKIYDEVSAVTERKRQLSLTDKSETPVLIACINEVHRIASVVSFNFFRRTGKVQYIDGYHVPANVPITAQISVIMADDETFPNHEDFDPTRFLEDENKASNVIAFGLGKRACPGESLARAELYLILGNLILECDIKPNGKVPEAKELNKSGFFKRPPRFECRINLRK